MKRKLVRECATLCFVLFCVSCTSGRIERAIVKADELRGTQQYEAALHAYALIVIEYPNHPKVADVLLRIGDLSQYTLKDTPQAVVAYQRILQDWPWQPATVQAHLRLAEIAMTKEDFTGAIEAYEQLLKYFPAYEKWDEVRHAIGVCYLKQKQYAQARIELFRLLERDHVSANVQAQSLYDVAEIYLLEGKPDAAIPYYQRLLASFPKHALLKQAKLQLFQAYTEAGDYPAAVALAQDLRRQYPDDEALRDRLRQLEGRPAMINHPSKLPWSK